MPLYEYECETCHKRFERIQKFSDPLIERCPTCDGPVRKLLSSPAIQFKGSGWYITDYPKKSSSDSRTTSSESKAEKSESKADKTETKADKPAASSDSSSKND